MVALRAERKTPQGLPLRSERSSPRAGERSESRAAPRKAVALRAWVMTLEGASRGYALDLSEAGCRLGGMGARFEVGARVLLKIELSPEEPCVVVRAQVARYQPVMASEAWACPELCLRFLDVNLDEWFRIARFLDRTR